MESKITMSDGEIFIEIKKRDSLLKISINEIETSINYEFIETNSFDQIHLKLNENEFGDTIKNSLKRVGLNLPTRDINAKDKENIE